VQCNCIGIYTNIHFSIYRHNGNTLFIKGDLLRA
jgi:hypothetical protein